MQPATSITRVWDRFRAWAILLVALLPVSLILVDLILGGGWLSDSATLSVLVVQLSILIGLLYDTQRLLDRERSALPGSIQEQEQFWSHTNQIGSLDVWALNGDRFVDVISTRHIRVGRLRLVLPSVAAVNSFYKKFTVVNEQNHAAAYIEDAIANVAAALVRLKASGHVQHFELRRVHSFPLQFYAVADAQMSLHGVYEADPDRPSSTGLRSRCWTHADRRSAEVLTTHFEGHWGATQGAT